MNGEFVLVGYDGSESARVAMTWAAQTAKALDVPVRLVSVVTEPEDTDRGSSGDEASDGAAERMLLAATHELRLETPGVPVQTLVVQGPLVPGLMGAAELAEIVVVGCRGRSAASEKSLGGTALKLAERLDHPVVVVRSRDYRDPGPEAGRVVVGVDGSPVATDAMAFAMDMAVAKGLGLTAVHAWQEPFGDAVMRGAPALSPEALGEMERVAQTVLSESLAGWRNKLPDLDIRQRLVRGPAVPSLVEASVGADLLVVGRHGRGAVRTTLLGSVSNGVVHHALCPVAVVHEVPPDE